MAVSRDEPWSLWRGASGAAAGRLSTGLSGRRRCGVAWIASHERTSIGNVASNVERLSWQPWTSPFSLVDLDPLNIG
jgi:hypothetical protein